MAPEGELVDFGLVVGHRPQVHLRVRDRAVEPELQGAVRLERFVGQVGVVVAVQARQRDFRGRVAQIDLIEAQRAGYGADAEVARGHAGIEIVPRPLTFHGFRRLFLNRRPSDQVVGTLKGDRHRRLAPQDADRCDEGIAAEGNRVRGAGIGIRARHLKQVAQVRVEDVHDAGGQVDNAIAGVQRDDQLLNAPQRHALVRQIAQQQVKLVVGDVDVFRGDLLGGQLAPTHGVIDHAPRVENSLRNGVRISHGRCSLELSAAH